MSAKTFYVRNRGKVTGPFDLQQLKFLRDRGQLARFHEVSEDRRKWVSATSMAELFSEPAASTVPVSLPVGGKGAGEGWLYADPNGKQQGPMGLEGLVELRRMQVINDATLVWKEGMAEWLPFSAVNPSVPVMPSVVKAAPPSTARWLLPAGVGLFVVAGTIGGFLYWHLTSGRNQTGTGPVGALASRSAGGNPSGEGSVPATNDLRKEPNDRPLEPKEIFARCSASVALIKNNRGSGSGFVARPGIIVTNSHVVQPDLTENILVTFPSASGGNKPLKAVLLYEDRRRDLAILHIDSPLKPLSIAERECLPGEKVVVIGSPGGFRGQLVENSVTAGELSARTHLPPPFNLEWYQISAAVNHGNSGGPVFNNLGQVIGVTTLGLSGMGKEGMNYAVPYTDVVKALDRAQAKNQKELDEVAAEHDLTVMFSRVGKCACLYLIAMDTYGREMEQAVNEGLKEGEGVRRASLRIDKRIHVGVDSFLDAESQAALPRVVGNKVLREETRQKMEELIALRSEMKDWFDRPHQAGNGQVFRKKTEECGNKLTRIFESMRLKLGVYEDPRLTAEEMEQFGPR